MYSEGIDAWLLGRRATHYSGYTRAAPWPSRRHLALQTRRPRHPRPPLPPDHAGTLAAGPRASRLARASVRAAAARLVSPSSRSAGG
eukprot:5832626-Prymnesium_polylepis.1